MKRGPDTVRARWHARPPRAGLAPRLRPWLTDPASLTARIRARSTTFAVKVLAQRRARARPDEARLLGVPPDRVVWLREVQLLAEGRPVVHARSLLALDSTRGGWQRFLGIGSRPLGAALFADPRIARGALHAARLDGRDARYHRARRAVPDATLPVALWARRSCFFRRGRRLLVCELFLPGILDLPD